MPSDSLVSLLSQPLWVFLTVLSRLAPVMMLTPPVKSGALPLRMRALLAISIAVLLTPIASPTATQMPPDLLHIVIALAGEILLGVLLGSIVALSIACLQISGQTISQFAGLDFAVTVDPMTQEEIAVLSNLFGLLAMAILLLAGGHRYLLGCAMDSLKIYPAGAVVFEGPWMAELEAMVQHTYEVGLRAAAPLAIALLLSNVATGLLARTLPQLNILSIGFSLNIGSLLIVLCIGLGSLSWVFQNELAVWLDSCHRIVDPQFLIPGDS